MIREIEKLDPPVGFKLAKPNLTPKQMTELSTARDEKPKLNDLVEKCEQLQEVCLGYEVWADLGTHRLILGKAPSNVAAAASQ